MQRTYNVFGQSYTFDTYLKVDERCNGVTFINRGDGVAFVNGIPLAPSPLGVGFAGESISFGGNKDELFRGMIDLKFAPGATVTEVVIVQKFYLDSI